MENDGYDEDKKSKKARVRAERRKKRDARVSYRLFRAIDIIFDRAQNNCPYVDKDIADKIICEGDVVFDDRLPDICKMDVYYVKSDKPQPAIILIHGGGFCAGDKKYRRGQSRFFAINGFKVFCINYGIAPDYVFPEPAKHVIAAANYICDNAESLNIDASRIIAAGDSSGAYYASVLAAVATNPEYAAVYGEDVRFAIKGTLLNCGLYDADNILQTKYAFNIDAGVFVNFIGMNKAEFAESELKDVCTPFGYIDSSFPPSFIIYSPGDFFCKEQGLILRDKLRSLGVYCEHYEAKLKSSIHCFCLTWRGEDAFAANELMLSFAKRLVEDKIKF